MTRPDPNSPFTPPHPPPPPPPTGDQGGSFYPNQPENWYYPTPPGGPQDQERNIIGIIALSVAILGFICACIPLLRSEERRVGKECRAGWGAWCLCEDGEWTK